MAYGGLEIYDGVSTFRGYRHDIYRSYSKRVANIKNNMRKLFYGIKDNYRSSFKISNDKKAAKDQADNAFFSLLFAEAIGGEFYEKARLDLVSFMKDPNLPSPFKIPVSHGDDHKKGQDLFCRGCH